MKTRILLVVALAFAVVCVYAANPFANNIAVGMIGKSFTERAECLEVLGKEECRINLFLVGYLGNTGMPQPNKKEVILRGVSTKDMADETNFDLKQELKVTGTTQYKTPSGRVRTLLLLEPVKESTP